MPADSKTGDFLPNGYMLFTTPEKAMKAYLQRYYLLDPCITSGAVKILNTPFRYTDIIQESILKRSEFACDFLLPYANVFYIMGAILASQGDTIGAIGLHKQKHEEDFSDYDKEIAKIVFPHIARAIHIIDLMKDLDLHYRARGVILMGMDGRLIYMNDEARVSLGEIPAQTIPEPGLNGRAVFFQGKSGKYRVRTLPLSRKGKGKIILLEPTPPKHRINSRLINFGLSKKEEEVAVLALQGFSNKEIAGRLFICEQTVKDHLEDVFEKAEVHSRGELTAKILGLRKDLQNLAQH